MNQTQNYLAELKVLANRINEIVATIEKSNVELSTPKAEKPTKRVEKRDVLDSFTAPPASASALYQVLKTEKSYGTALIAFVNEQIGYKRGAYTLAQWNMFKAFFRENPVQLKCVVAELKRIAELLKPMKFQKEVEPIARKLIIEILQKGYGINAIRQFKDFLVKNRLALIVNSDATDTEKKILLKFWFGCAVGYNELKTKSWFVINAESEIKPFVAEQTKLF